MTVAEVTQDVWGRTVRLPGDFFPGESKVYINKIGNSVVLIPYNEPWKSLFDSLNEFSADFMEVRDQPKEQTRENIF
jgi:antitoxin VapB